jgi:hypothetical protein
MIQEKRTSRVKDPEEVELERQTLEKIKDYYLTKNIEVSELIKHVMHI